ncbi:MAG: prohibitin family protein [Deltaproteobacteria bacterium]|nr:prohibitin family protein [Deltaproteobacteria bacterium]
MSRYLPILALSLLTSCSASTESTEIGVRTVNVTFIGSNGVMDEIYPQGGTYFFLRAFSEWSVFDVGLQNLAMRRATNEAERATEDAVKFKTVDGNDISVDVTVAWSIEPDRAPYVLQFIGANNAEVEDKLVRPVARTVVRDVLNQLTSEEYYEADRRFQMAIEAQVRLNQIIGAEGIHVEQVLLGEHKFNETYEGIIRDKKVAEQEAARLLSETEAAGAEMKRDLERAKGEVSKTIEEALGESAKRRLEADAILFERERQATAILSEKKANAEGLLARGRAMGGSGGKNMVKLRIAESLQGKKMVFVPAGSMDLRTTDMNALLGAYGIQAARAAAQTPP